MTLLLHGAGEGWNFADAMGHALQEGNVLVLAMGLLSVVLVGYSLYWVFAPRKQ